MKLMTKELEKKFEKFPICSQDGLMEEAEVIVKYFFPFGRATWLITEGDKGEDGDWEFFGCFTLGQEWEWGYVTLRELEEIGWVERDLYCKGKKVKDLI